MEQKKEIKKAVKKETKWFKLWKSNDLNQFFFWKSLNVNQLLNKAVDDLLYQIFIQNSDVQASIRDKNNLSFQYWFYFVDQEWTKIDDIEMEKEYKSILNSFQKFKNFKTEFNTYRNVFWNVYTYLLRNEGWQIVWLQNLDPRQISEVEDETTWIVIWYNFNKAFIKKEDIVHFKNWFNPNNKLKGFSPLSWAVLDLLADNEAARSNFMYFLNWTIPAWLVKFKEWTSDEEIKMYIDAMVENYSWWNNQHKIGWMKGIEWFERLQKEFKDMEFIVLRNFSTEKVATSLWVPVSRLNKINTTYNNMSEAYNQYIESIIIPENNDLRDHLNEIYNMIYEWTVNIEYVDDYIDNKEYILKNWILQIQNWITTPWQVAEELWYDIVDEELQNKLYITSSLIWMEDAWIQWFNPWTLNEPTV